MLASVPDAMAPGCSIIVMQPVLHRRELLHAASTFGQKLNAFRQTTRLHHGACRPERGKPGLALHNQVRRWDIRSGGRLVIGDCMSRRRDKDGSALSRRHRCSTWD
ncbi:hypothetical protein ACFS07_30965 [Undibacterium arcticum]